MTLRFSLIFLVLFTLFLLPIIAFAKVGGIVPDCGYLTGVGGELKDCSFGDLIKLGQNILNYIVTISVIVSAIMFAYAGWLYFSDGGSEKNIASAHKIFTSVIIGIILILTAWLIVNTILEVLTPKGLDERSREVSFKGVDILYSIG